MSNLSISLKQQYLYCCEAPRQYAVRRTVERNALRDLLDEIRKEKAGEWARAAFNGKNKNRNKEK